MKKRSIYTGLLLGLTLLVMSCKKGWLDAKPDKSLIVPIKVAEFQSLLDNVTGINYNDPALGDLSADDHYIPYDDFLAATTSERNAYIWAKDIYQGETGFDWNYIYKKVFNANVVLDGIDAANADGSGNAVKGSAIFLRALNFYYATQEFCIPYKSSTAASALGVPLRLTSDVNKVSVRATLQASYEKIISDLNTAKILLPLTPLYKTRPSKPAVYGLLARIYLSMEDYTKAGLYADSTLQLYNKLVDFNTLDRTAFYPIPLFHDEDIYHSEMSSFLSLLNAPIDSTLYNSYGAKDLRKVVFFNGDKKFQGSYSGGYNPYSGIATDEIYLIRAETYARANKVDMAMADLNLLLSKRFEPPYTPLTASSAAEALGLVLKERRKELVYRGLRWSDLRRLNTDSKFAVILTRNLNGTIYSLAPNDPKYVFPIPDDEIRLSGIQQNQR